MKALILRTTWANGNVTDKVNPSTLIVAAAKASVSPLWRDLKAPKNFVRRKHDPKTVAWRLREAHQYLAQRNSYHLPLPVYQCWATWAYWAAILHVGSSSVHAPLPRQSIYYLFFPKLKLTSTFKAKSVELLLAAPIAIRLPLTPHSLPIPRLNS